MLQHVSDEPFRLLPRCLVFVSSGARKPHEHSRPPLSIVCPQQAGDNGQSLPPHQHIIVVASGGKKGQMRLSHAGILHAKLSKHLMLVVMMLFEQQELYSTYNATKHSN